MRYMTEKNLKEAFSGESQAHVRYSFFADKAEKEGEPNLAKLFRAVAYAEFVHAVNHLRALSQGASTTENLESAVSGEIFEITEMYPLFIEVARMQGESAAERTMQLANEVEQIHRQLFSRAQQMVKKERT